MSETQNPVYTASPSPKIDLAYGLLGIGIRTLLAITSGWLLYFYLPPNGTSLLPAFVYSALMLATSLIQALLEPVIGYWSDRTQTRWGRRKPFMLIAPPVILLLFILLWTPPTPQESAWNIIYLGIILAGYKIFASLYQIPHYALMPELALTETHRVRISAWFASFELFGMIMGSFAGAVIEKLGYLTTALVCAGALLPLFYIPWLVLRERPNYPTPTSKSLNFRQDLRTTLKNDAFRVFILTRTLGWGAATLLQVTIPFIVTEICLLTRADTLYFYLPAIAAALICYPLIHRMARRWGRRRIFSGSLLASACVLPGLALIQRELPLPLFAQGVIWIVLESIAIAGFSMLQSVFIAEITDYDAALTGQRREGAYFAAWGFCSRLISGAAEALLPLLLVLGRSYTDPHGPLGVRMTGIVGGILMLLAWVAFRSYPIQEQPVIKTTNA